MGMTCWHNSGMAVLSALSIVTDHSLVATAKSEAEHKEQEEGMHMSANPKHQKKKLAGLAGLPY